MRRRETENQGWATGRGAEEKERQTKQEKNDAGTLDSHGRKREKTHCDSLHRLEIVVRRISCFQYESGRKQFALDKEPLLEIKRGVQFQDPPSHELMGGDDDEKSMDGDRGGVLVNRSLQMSLREMQEAQRIGELTWKKASAGDGPRKYEAGDPNRMEKTGTASFF